MSRHWIALLAASALVFGNISAGAQAVAASQIQPPTSAVAKNEPALKPAGAAGIREAQGVSDRGVLIASGLILAGIVAALLLVDTGDDGTVTATESN